MNRLLEAIALPGPGLALFRRGLGLLCLLDAVQRLSQARLLYSDEGVLPRWALFEYFPSGAAWSLYCLSGQTVFVSALLLVTAALGALQAWGKAPRWARLALWVLVMSAQQRNPAVTDAADDLLRLLLFWDVFLPDHAQGDIVTLATLGLQWQLSLSVLATSSLWATPARWLLAAQWGLAPQAARFPWLGLSLVIAVPAIWWAGARRILRWPLCLLLLLQGGLLDPAYPATLAVGLTCLWSRPEGRTDVVTAPAFPPLPTVAWALACLISLTLTLWPAAATSWLAPVAQGFGLRQRWSQVYPLAERQRAEVILRAQGYTSALFNLDMDSGRRLRLYSQAVLAQPLLAVPLGQSFAERLGLREPVAVWLRSQQLSGDDLTIPRQEVQVIDWIRARPGAEPQGGGVET